MKIYNIFPGSLLVASLLAQLSSVTAFATAPAASSSSVQTSSSTKLFVSTIYSEFSDARKLRSPLPDEDIAVYEQDLSLSGAFDAVSVASSSLPDYIARSMDLPKHGPSAQQVEATQTLLSLEMLIGRGAMLMAVILMATELATGSSLPEQLATFHL